MKKHFVTGLVVLLPVALTFWVVSFIFKLLTDPFLGVAELLLSTLGVESHELRMLIGKILALAFLFALIIGIGIVGRHFFFSYLMTLSDALLKRIPVISSVYKTSQELIQTLMSTSGKSFQKVVLVPFPHAKALTIGFITREDTEIEGRVAVFIPTTPNPTSGFLIMYTKDQIIPVDLKVEEALRFVISCGVLPTPIHKVLPKV
jgi:uncharacterized membrane protein